MMSSFHIISHNNVKDDGKSINMRLHIKFDGKGFPTDFYFDYINELEDVYEIQYGNGILQVINRTIVINPKKSDENESE